ncbi:hypothetical protein NCCP2222_11980 [Sporosarcina sp. NCCP-2222]|uniref:hypothetical protein n=1 Tax=Sporosarcina sp. NCCP-2222 TaxID=2935073 RepID=UPI00208B61C6|nr:hypothetical protein [Sporosarcina sp. NCCP-2222]GKV55251.1 hypothetical protein NCCP2222_11980 [Sporosarcina sp. NCCP-2222]
MKQWNGLLLREWMPIKWQMISSFILFGLGLLGLPFFLGSFLEILQADSFEIATVLCFVWAAFSVFVPLFTFFMLFYRDMKKPDLWLHSTASIYQLVGVKMVVAILVGLASLLLSVVVVAIWYVFTNQPFIVFDELLFYGSLFISAVFLGSISLMFVGFFFVVLDQLMKPYIKGFSVVVTLLLFILSVRLYSIFVSSQFYEMFILQGKLDMMNFKNHRIDLQDSYFEITSTTFYIGEWVFNLACLLLFFIIGAMLLEKKVRR